MKDFFQTIAARLAASVPELRLIDLEKGQTDDPDQRPGIDFPAALIELETPNCEENTGRHQQCRATITVRIAARAVADEPPRSTPAARHARSIAILETVQTVANALQGFDCGLSSPLSRTALVAEPRHDGLKVYRLLFSADFDETFDA